MELFNTLLSWFMKKRISQIELFKEHPIEVQNEVLANLLGKSRNTEWGRKYSFENIKSYHDFKSVVPIVRYEDIADIIEQVMKGEDNILWPSEIKWFSKSSGTTNAKSKFIPVSNEALEDCHFKAGKDLLSMYLNNYPESKLFTGKGLVIGGSSQVNHLNSKSSYGDISAVIMKNLPLWAQYVRVPSLDIALMENWEEKIEKMAHAVKDENITSITGVPTWTIVLLQRILELTGKKKIIEVWPNLELFAHGAVAFGPYRHLFDELIGAKINYIDSYNASEGFFAIQDRSDHEDMLLMLDYGIFYEFLPTEYLDKDHSKVVTLEEVELDKNYAMIITTNAGLWRYMIGDTIKFTTKSPYRIKITGRTKHFINAFGEEMVIENAETAIAEACKQSGASIENFTAAPIYLEVGKRGGHEWVIEFITKPDSIETFTEILDNKLKAINSDYEAKRQKDIALIKPRVHIAPEKTFYNWMKKRGKLGGQHKVPRLSNSREFIDEILKIIST
ncbi:GH3 auxin-responsive promoter family protein [Hyphobacterium sp. CCMP332]|nr:GH3 auxin-responsive promoter family protein [Hyphobacterium sp. CCMP332]